MGVVDGDALIGGGVGLLLGLLVVSGRKDEREIAGGGKRD